ncbi:hypothetical protein TraAM80_00314 [Trypanosoma rangeli]|uniref:E3 ubiquitin-protein ligase listerin n=1 Tax=Trypanosoma rangeli TaxID=5698 RepID=A0A3R7KS45_TRYRA|nr:uncharacterized protein TraAM80_00314 [Trypanosoma rangeli]RNF12462.1 hypothetical protein TraAM80_00314 [Trypanosoma rangeli]|eukprot:RNF12462.1 hypothetical protein TraAM80_00314 [Trypanosoma rangeli]
MPPRPAKGRAAQSFVKARGAPDSLQSFLGGLSIPAQGSADDAAMIEVNLKLLHKTSEVTLFKALSELNRLVAVVAADELISYVPSIIESVLRHAEHHNASVRAGVFGLLLNIVQRGKPLQREVVRGLPSLAVVWVLRMNDMESFVRKESRAAFSAAITPEMLHRHAETIVEGLIETFQTVIEQSRGKPLQDDNLDRRSNTLYSSMCGMGYMMRQPVAARAKIIDFVESQSLQPILPTRDGNAKISLVAKTPVVCSASLSLLWDIVNARLMTPKLHCCVSSAIHNGLFNNEIVVMRRVWELLLLWSGDSTETAIDYFEDDFLQDVMCIFVRCHDLQAVEVIFPSIVPLLVPLTRDPRCADTAAEFGETLVHKLHRLGDVSLQEWRLVLSALMQLWELLCVRSAKRGDGHEQDGVKLFHHMLITLATVMESSAARARYLDATVSIVALSMKRAARHEESFCGCLLVLCSHPDAFTPVLSEDASDALRQSFDLLQAGILGAIVTLPGVSQEMEQLITKYLRNKVWEPLLVLLQACTPPTSGGGEGGTSFTPTREVRLEVAKGLVDAIRKDASIRKEKQLEEREAEADEVPLIFFKKLLELVLIWNDAEIRGQLQTLVVGASDELCWVKDAIILDDMRDSERFLGLVLRACEDADFCTMERFVEALGEVQMTLSKPAKEQLRQALQHSLDAILRLVSDEDGAAAGKAEGESQADSDTACSKRSDATEGEASSDDSDEDVAGEEEEEEEEEEDEDEVNRAGEVLQRLSLWCDLLYKGKRLPALLDFSGDDLILPTLFRIVATISPRLHAEQYMSIKALRVALRDDKDPLLHAMARKKHYLGVRQFSALVEKVEGLLDSYEVGVEQLDTASLELFDDVMRDPSCGLAACGQLSRLIPFASSTLLQGIVCSTELWVENQVLLRCTGVPTTDVPFAMLDRYCSLDVMDLSLLRCVRTAQLVHLLARSVPIETCDTVAVLLPLLRAARVQEVLSEPIRKLLMTKLLPHALLRVNSRDEVVALLDSDAEPHLLLCTLAAVIRDTAVCVGDAVLESARRIACVVTEWMINSLLLKEGAAPVNEKAVAAYRAFFASLDEAADVIGDSILSSITARHASAVQEAMCMLPTLPPPTALLTMTMHRHLSTAPVVVASTVQQVVTYAQHLRPLDGFEFLAELSSSRILDTAAYNELVHTMTHLLSRCCRLRHMPPNGRLLSQAPNELPMSLQDLRRVVVSAVSALRGGILHGRLDDILRSSINLILFDAVTECVVSLRQTKEEDVPLVTKLIAFTSNCLSELVTSDVAVLRASEITVTKVAGVMNFAYQWLCATPIAKLESIGTEAVASAISAVSLVSVLTLMRSGVVLLPIMRQITAKRLLRNLRQEFSTRSPAKLKLFTRNTAIIMKTKKQKLALFPHLLAWCVTLSGAVQQDIAKERREEVLHLLDLLCSLLLTPVVPGNKRLDGTYLCTTTKTSGEHLGFETVALTRPNAAEPMKELAKGAAAVFALLLQSNTLSVVKSWLETIERKLQDLFYVFVEEHVSPMLIQESLLTVLSRSPTGEPTFDVNENYNVTVSMPKKLITLRYTMEDASVMVQIEIPAAFPLKPPMVTFESGKGCGVSTEKWRAWMLKMTILLFGGSANIWECVTVFGRNMDAHFSGQEPCPICFSVVSAVDHRLPDMQCAVCRNAALHSYCLYAWWANSGQTVCPLCRSPWVSS